MLGLWVPGTPGPKGSITRNRYGHAYNMSHIGTAWQQAVAETCSQTSASRQQPPFLVELVFHVKRPKRPKHAWPATSDLDKLVRATIDGLVEGGLLLDDRHVTALSARKLFSDTAGAWITIRTDDLLEDRSDGNGGLLLRNGH